MLPWPSSPPSGPSVLCAYLLCLQQPPTRNDATRDRQALKAHREGQRARRLTPRCICEVLGSFGRVGKGGRQAQHWRLV
uniref:Putative secreted protein n=1 Tax=Anopheles darlingi TaxID=43151 RepID=A0A2M4DBW1_ANODA